MFAPIYVSFSGPAFSFLLYENSKCRFQQEGFLLGEIVQKETKTITDNEHQQINITKIIKINSIMPCPYSHLFYKGSGRLLKEKLSDFLGIHMNRVVAWYKYQRVGNVKFTLRDNMIHDHLMEIFKVPPELFSCCLLNNEISETAGTYTYSQMFLRVVHQKIDRLPVSIPNLSEPNNSYKNSEPASETFKKILSDLKIDRKAIQGSVVINRIQDALQKHINSVIEKLSKSEQYMHELEKEVTQLAISTELKKRNGVSPMESGSPLATTDAEDSDRLVKGIDTTSSEKESSPELTRRTCVADGISGRGDRKEPTATRERLK